MASPTTTVPSSQTGQRLPGNRGTLIRWEFPKAAVTKLQAGQVIGRDASCDCVLPGNEISREHAEIRLDGPVVSIWDRNSRNGLYINGLRTKGGPLLPGDVVRCGEWVGVVVIEAERELGGFREIDVGWFGGAGLRAATDPVRQLPADLPVIIQGETGTGKEGMARFVHRCSGRKGELVAVNCAALPAELAEAEFFGYRKGAFTGAHEASAGLFRAADGGTLFLDEILDLPLGLQAKLLRVIESKVVRGLGEVRDVPVDVRLVAATQDSLSAAVVERRFRSDLLARLDGLTIVLPPLRKRREDIVPLFLNFARASGREPLPEFEPKLIEALCLFDWPMNVRQLFQQARRLMAVHGQEPLLRRSHLPDWMLTVTEGAPSAGAGQGIVGESTGGAATGPVTGGAGGARASAPGRRKTDDEAEFEALMLALREHDGSVAQAAAALGISRQRAYRVLGARPGFSLDDVRKPS